MVDPNDSKVPWQPGHPPATWGEVQWPDWVPQKLRDEIQSFWSDRHGRGPKDYEESAYGAYNGASALGLSGWYRSGMQTRVYGRYVHAWSNIGRVIDRDGRVHVCSGKPGSPPAELVELFPRLTASTRARIEAGEIMPLVYVLDAREVVGNCASWWCPDSKGYTCELGAAGLYAEGEIRNERGTDVSVPRELAEQMVISHVRLDHLRQRMEIPYPDGRRPPKRGRRG